MALDSTIAEAHASLGRALADYDWDASGAKKAFRRAIALNPGYALAHSLYARWLLTPLGRFDDAIREARLGLRLDPLSPYMHYNLAVVLNYARRYENAIEEARRTVEMLPDWAAAHTLLGNVYPAKGMSEAALAEFQTALKLTPHRLDRLADLGSYYATTGSRGEATEILEQVRSRAEAPGDVIKLAEICLGLGERDSALAALERVFAMGARPAMIGVRPAWDPLRGEPRFQRLLRNLGLER